MYPEPNPLIAKVRADHPVHGLFIQNPGAEAIEIAAHVGMDFVILDEEHGNFGFSETVNMIRFAEAARITPLVRVNGHDVEHIRKVIEAGALGVYVPRVETAEQAETVVAAARYAYEGNGGTMGACPSVRAARSMPREQWEDFLRWSNDNVMITVLIESPLGLDNLEHILKVEGIDYVALGVFDLNHEFGLYSAPPVAKQKALQDAMGRFKEVVDAAGMPYLEALTTFEHDAAREQYAALVAAGQRYFVLGSDRMLLDRACREVMSFTGRAPAAGNSDWLGR